MAKGLETGSPEEARERWLKVDEYRALSLPEIREILMSLRGTNSLRDIRPNINTLTEAVLRLIDEQPK